MLKLDILKNLPLVPANLFERKFYLNERATLKNDLTTLQSQLLSKFSEEVIEAITKVITVPI